MNTNEFAVKAGLFEPSNESVLAPISDLSLSSKSEEALLKAGALQSAIFNSANFYSRSTIQSGKRSIRSEYHAIYRSKRAA